MSNMHCSATRDTLPVLCISVKDVGKTLVGANAWMIEAPHKRVSDELLDCVSIAY